jgi:hypothetical protein
MFHGATYVASRPWGLRSAVGLLTLLGGAAAASPATATPNDDVLSVFANSPLMPEASITMYVLLSNQTGTSITPTGSVSVTPAGGSAVALPLAPVPGSRDQFAAIFQFAGYAALGGHDFSVSYGGGGLDPISTTYTANVELIPTVGAPAGTELPIVNSGNLALVVNLGNSGATGVATVIDLTDNVIEQNVPVTGGIGSLEIDGVPAGPKLLLEEFDGQTALLQVSAVPEPATLPLAAAGLFVLALVRRRSS